MEAGALRAGTTGAVAHADERVKPSKVTVPIITATSATDPAPGLKRGRPPSSRR